MQKKNCSTRLFSNYFLNNNLNTKYLKANTTKFFRSILTSNVLNTFSMLPLPGKNIFMLGELDEYVVQINT